MLNTHNTIKAFPASEPCLLNFKNLQQLCVFSWNSFTKVYDKSKLVYTQQCTGDDG